MANEDDDDDLAKGVGLLTYAHSDAHDDDDDDRMMMMMINE